MAKSRIETILEQVKSLDLPDGVVKLFNEEDKHYATLCFQVELRDMITDEIFKPHRYQVDYFLPSGNFNEEYHADNEYDKMILSIYNAEETSYNDFEAHQLELAKSEGEQIAFRFSEAPEGKALGDIEETLRINYDHNLHLWVFESQEGKYRVEDQKHLAVQILRDFYNAVPR